MNNLEKAKKTLEESKADELAIENAINPPKVVRTPKPFKVPLARDITLVGEILNKKLEEKGRELEDKITEETRKTYKTEVDAIHLAAIALRKEADTLTKKVIQNSAGAVKAGYMGRRNNNYGRNYGDGYFTNLPEDMAEATKEDFFEVEWQDIPVIKKLQKEIDSFINEVKLGLAPIADVKPLMTKIETILI